MRGKKKILPQMFDVRPVDKRGELDMERIEKAGGVVEIKTSAGKKTVEVKNTSAGFLSEEHLPDKPAFAKATEGKSSFAKATADESSFAKATADEGKKDNIKNFSISFEGGRSEQDRLGSDRYFSSENEDRVGRRTVALQKFLMRKSERKTIRRKKMKTVFGLIFVALIVFFVFFSFSFAKKGMELKNRGLIEGEAAFSYLLLAKESLATGDFQSSYIQFESAQKKLSHLSQEIDGFGTFLVKATKYIPYASKISSASNLVLAGEDISQVGALMSEILTELVRVKGNNGAEKISYLEIWNRNEEKIEKIAALFQDAQEKLDEVNVDDIPEESRGKFIQIKKTLPEVNLVLQEFLRQKKIFVDTLGGHGPRKYLFLFQNNQEMRPTGGFIGSYGLLDIFDGRVRNFYIDGIFNPDGQLKERIVPPRPIQKISADWSLHDSNWFPDFPISAEKAAWFFEKTGGPSVDGVITMTPTVLEKLLDVTGPIEMDEYGVTVDKNNFVEKIQYEVEIDYDKELNQPKKILADLAPKILEKISSSRDHNQLIRTLKIIVESLDEKHILVYSKNEAIQEQLGAIGWSGEIIDTPKDYLSVINTNINGFKTDGVVSEKIEHESRIGEDGVIVNKVTITRRHDGGDSAYEWWNHVNADYMRLYVPLGAKLLGVEGQTREVNTPVLDYDALGYKRDSEVRKEEEFTSVDSGSGTRIYEDGGKTVFANWVYVSPKETVKITYTYLLPFKVEMDGAHPASSYSLLAQKQSGSFGSELVSEVIYPSFFKTLWRTEEDGLSTINNLPNGEAGIKMETDLETDKFMGVAFSR